MSLIFIFYFVCIFFVFIDEGQTPHDITAIGVHKEMKPQELATDLIFPKELKRSFHRNWLQTFIWIEYSISVDAIFCYPCRQFAILASLKDKTFTHLGYRNWKHALEKNKGLYKHDTSSLHVDCMRKWAEKSNRMDTGSEISEQLSGTVLTHRRYYMQSVIEAIIFVVQNEN